jgi:hypothetical protein
MNVPCCVNTTRLERQQYLLHIYITYLTCGTSFQSYPLHNTVSMLMINNLYCVMVGVLTLLVSTVSISLVRSNQILLIWYLLYLYLVRTIKEQKQTGCLGVMLMSSSGATGLACGLLNSELAYKNPNKHVGLV